MANANNVKQSTQVQLDQLFGKEKNIAGADSGRHKELLKKVLAELDKKVGRLYQDIKEVKQDVRAVSEAINKSSRRPH